MIVENVAISGGATLVEDIAISGGATPVGDIAISGGATPVAIAANVGPEGAEETPQAEGDPFPAEIGRASCRERV